MSLPAAQANIAPPVPSGGADNLTCQWQGCTQPNHPSPEALYEHVCETHIGRKSTNNLNLQCFWGACRTTTVKRDHITSHIRVHVPLKPHKCDFCGKSFKRPQDLKKHVKTHADESVLLNSPQTGAGASRSQANGYHGQPNGKSSGFYGDGGLGASMNYGGPGYPNMQNGGYGHYAGGPTGGMQGSHYGGPQYNIPQMSSYAGSGLTESRKRTHDALNEFFGNAKRNQIDAHAYQDLRGFGNAMGMMGAMGPGFQGGFNSGFGGGMDHGGGVAYQAQPAPMMQPGYGMAFPELRTKNDLLSIDQFLEQLQNTVYDNPADMAAHGAQPVADMVYTGMNPSGRGSHSPPRQTSSVGTPSAISSASQAYSNMEDTPALTPASFQASHSPSSTQQTHSPASRPAGSVGYPTLPSFQTIDPQSNQFAQWPTGSVPPSGLGSQFDEYEHHPRRGSGSKLQRARVSPPSDKAMSPSSHRDSPDQQTKNVEMSTPPQSAGVKLPGVAQITSGEEKRVASEGEAGKPASPEGPQAAHQRNLRVIEALRQYVKGRLTRNEYENEQDESGKTTPRAHQSDTEMVDADADDASSKNGSTPKREGPGIAYPNLSKATEV